MTGESDKAVSITFIGNKTHAVALVMMDGNGTSSLLYIDAQKKTVTTVAGVSRTVAWSDDGMTVSLSSCKWNFVTVITQTSCNIAA